MRRPWLMAAVAWPVVLVLYSLLLTAVVVVAKDDNETNDNTVKLKVDIRKETLVGAPSCQHTFTQIELLNLHSTDPIMIHSIQTTPEETVLIRSETNGAMEGRKWEDHAIPQQIHVSKLQTGSVSLGPGQVAIVPVTFLPRFPNLEKDDGVEEQRRRRLHNNRGEEDDDDETSCQNGDIGDILEDNDEDNDGKSPPPISAAALHDLVDMVGGKHILQTMDNKRLLSHTLDPSYRRRNNLDPSSLPDIDEFEVTTTVVVDTSRGVVKLPVTASSIRENLYEIPDTIQFHHPSFQAISSSTCDTSASGECNSRTDESTGASPSRTTRKSSESFYSMNKVIILDSVHAMDREVRISKDVTKTAMSTKHRRERECFDLHLSNPMPDRELQIVEALVSKPDFISIKFDPGRVSGVPDSNLLVGSGASQVIRQWSQEGPLYLPPDSDDNYVLTLCTAFAGEVERDEGSETYVDEMTKWIDTGNQDRNLGFLQIRTDGETLFIGLEHSDDIPYLSLKNSSESMGREGNLVAGGMTASGTVTAPSTVGMALGSSTSLLNSYPNHLDFTMISPSSPPSCVDVGIQNKSPVPIQIMRVTAAIDTDGDLAALGEIEALGLQVNVTVASGGTFEKEDRQINSLILEPAASLDNVLRLRCSVSPSHFVSGTQKDAYAFNGTVIIRGTMDTELSYGEWLEATLQNPYRDEHLTIEIPFSVSVLNGRIEAIVEGSSHPRPELFHLKPWDMPGQAVSHLIFPLNQYTALPSLDDFTPQQMFLASNEISHDIRIVSNNPFPLVLESASVVADEEQAPEARSLCQRFNVSTVKTNEETGLYRGFDELGRLVLKYKFGKLRKSSMIFEGSAAAPIRCSLEVSTSPVEAGSFSMPLLIFTGHLEVTSMDPPDRVGAPSVSGGSGALAGFADLLNWCKSSSIGSSFVELLRAKFEDRIGSRSDSNLLSMYIKRLGPFSEISPPAPRYLPVVLRVGAVDHGEVARTSLFLTNRNPLPISVSIDVGELEGAEIELSREGSLAGGDGNSLWDYLPSQGSAGIVEKGGFVGHPVDGILEFLMSNRMAQDFISGFRFRDSISPHHPSLEGSSLLRSMYDWHSRATFHRSLFDEKPNSMNRPPEYDETSNGFYVPDSVSGPLIMTCDRKLAKPLHQYQGRPSRSVSNNILIPPGAKARFLVQIRAPPKKYLENDISHLLGTGLVLSTSLGDVIPIFAAFEALQGQLQATNPLEGPFSGNVFEFGPSMLRYENISVINVPLQYSWYSGGSDRLKRNESEAVPMPSSELQFQEESDATEVSVGRPNSRRGVPLYLKSSFARTMRLTKLESCNPWFSVTPVKASLEGQSGNNGSGGVLVGYLSANVDCSAANATGLRVPSYYQCLYNWFLNRLTIQPENCGLGLLSDTNKDLRRIENIKIALRHGLWAWTSIYQVVDKWKGLTVDFDQDPTEANLAHAKTGRPRDNAAIPDRDFYATLLKAIEVSTNYGYNWLSSSLTATVEYDLSPNSFEGDARSNRTQNLTLSMHDLALKTILEPPRFFRTKNSASISYRLPSTPIGSVSEAYIPLYNPTGVPVTVRIRVPGTTTTSAQSKGDHQVIFGETAGSLVPAPYVQNGDRFFSLNRTSHHSWWEGEGAFFIHDPYGDVIRSRHNITIKAGAGAIVSLVNPSLHAQVGFLAGCGRRCGFRDESNQFLDYNAAYSPIGASAAAGITLTGRIRIGSPHTAGSPEPRLLAGGISVSGTGGPSAFAVPFSSLDEIVIPPFGTGQLGPIYFRPPGSYKGIGCNVAKQSGAKLTGLERDLCKTRAFESLIYLDNSMTGLEKVLLEGQSLLERVIFVDPSSMGGEEGFADIENRNGKPTLLFSLPPLSTEASIRHVSVTRQAVLHNDGDTVAEIASVGIGGEPGGRRHSRYCSFGNFRLRDCWSGTPNEMKSGAENLHSGFSLKPGENRSIVVEYVHDCTRKVEYVNLVAELRSRTPAYTTTDDLFQSRFRRQRKPFSSTEVRLRLRYETKDGTLGSCLPGEGSAYGGTLDASLVLQVGLLLCSVLLLCFALRARFYAMWGMLQKVPTYLAYSQLRNASPQRSRSHWNAAFRCLARADPSSTELQGLSREQMRQVVSGLYKAKGVAPPSSLNSSNIYSRDRRTLAPSSARTRIGKDVTAGNDRIRTLSDAFFQDTVVADEASLRRHLPTGIGWRTAFSRGILKEDSVKFIAVGMKARALQAERDVSEHHDESNDDGGHHVVDPKESENNSAGVKDRRQEQTVNSGVEVQLSENRPMKRQPTDPETGEALSVVSTSESEGTAPKPSNDRSMSEETCQERIGDDNLVKRDKHSPVQKANGGSDKTASVKNALEHQGAELLTSNGAGRSIRTGITRKSGKGEKDNDTVSSAGTPKLQKQKDRLQLRRESRPSKKDLDNKKSGRISEKADVSTKEFYTPERKSKAGPEKSVKTGKKSSERGVTHVKEPGKKKKSNEIDSQDAGNVASSIRPPPGLAPPPGFGGSPSIAPFSATAERIVTIDAPIDNLTSLESMLDAALTGRAEAEFRAELAASPSRLPFSSTNSSMESGDMFFSRNLHAETAQSPLLTSPQSHFSFSRPTQTSVLPLEDAPLPLAGNTISTTHAEKLTTPVLLEESQNGFDVMDFLDSILNEGGPLDDPDETNLANAMIGSPGNTTPVLANPWASESKSRASAYGISFDEDDDSISIGSTSTDKADGTSDEGNPNELGGSIPLLTPAAILNANENENEECEGNAVSTSFLTDLVDD